MHLSQEALAALLCVSPKTVSLWERENEQPRGREQLAQLLELQAVLSLGRKVYTKEGSAQFLKSPLPAFGGHTAAALLAAGGLDQVLGALAADQGGLGF